MLGDSQYIADTLLIEKVIKLNAALAADSINKEAQLGSLLTGAAEQVKSTTSNLIDTSSTGAFIKSVLKMLEPAIFFRIHPLLGILDTIAQTFFNISLTSILSSIVGKIYSTIMAGQKVTPQQINEAGSSLVDKTASDDLLSDLRNIEKKGELTKIAFLGGLLGGSSKNQRGGAMAFPAKGTSLLHRVFGFLGPGRGKSLLVGFVVWFLKTALLSVGMLAIGGAAAALIMPSKESGPETGAETSSPGSSPGSSSAPGNSSAPRSSLVPKWGLDVFKNDANNVWIVPLNGRTPRDVLLDWMGWAYPELSAYENIAANLPSFNNTLRLFRQKYVPSSKNLIVPPGYTRPIDIVNQFASDVQKQIK